MKLIDKIHCIVCKFLTTGVIAMGILFTPFQYYYNELVFSFGSVIAMMIVSGFIMWMGFRGLIDTNNPKTKWNPFTFNQRWTAKVR